MRPPLTKSDLRSIVISTFTLVFLLELLNCRISQAEERIDYQSQVEPILREYCLACHTQSDPEGGYVMESYQELLRGGEHGAAITPGTARSSRLIQMLEGTIKPTMPPEGEVRPTESEIGILTQWIEQGAAGPEGPPQLKRDIQTPTLTGVIDRSLPITAIARSSTSDFIAKATYGKIDITDSDGNLITSIKDELHKINSLVFSTDGTQLLVGSGRTGAYGAATIYSTQDGQRIMELVGHRDMLYQAVYSPDETLVATAGYDREIILWSTKTGEPIRKLSGHNGAIFGLRFLDQGKYLISACADETLKIWEVATGQRLHTLGQPEGEVYSVTITEDERFIIAGGADHRVRIWEILRPLSQVSPKLVATRYVDDSPVTHLRLANEEEAVAAVTENGSLKILETNTWMLQSTLEELPDTATSVLSDKTGGVLTICMMNGMTTERRIPKLRNRQNVVAGSSDKIYMDLGDPATLNENELEKVEAVSGSQKVSAKIIPRHAQLDGAISQSGQADFYRWTATEMEQWAIDVDASKESPLDPIVTILDADLQPVLRTQLLATRESYFTFRGKDSMQVGDFRLFNWQEMHLDDYLYSSGEVTRLWLYPRGPDSGYNVYPNEGQRWTYFGTTHTTHALGEPAYVVRPLDPGEVVPANGLPTFNVYYENDDDPMRRAGKNSRLIFSAPATGHYYVRITDTRGMGGDNFKYQARIRPATPSYIPSVAKANGKMHAGTGREFTVRVDRLDGFNGEVTFNIPDLPSQFVSNLPITIEAGQRSATGCIWLPHDAMPWENPISPELVATAKILGKRVERKVGSVGDFTYAERASAIPTVHPIDREVASNESWTLQVRRGETVSARVVIDRKEGFNNEVSFGKEDAGRNSVHGVYVDNIGLNGLLVRQNETVREFFLTADPIAKVGKRYFHLKGANDGGVTTHPIIVEVLP